MWPRQPPTCSSAPAAAPFARIALAAAAALLLGRWAAPVGAQPAAEPRLAEEQVRAVERVVRETMGRSSIPGLSVAIGMGNRPVWAAGYGLADEENGVPVTDRTIFRTASIAKSITAIGIMQLAERGKIDLDAPIQRYVPAFARKRWTVTPRHLLSHTSGVRHYQGDEEHNSRHFTRMADALSIFGSSPLMFEPGTNFAYTTYGYVLLGLALEGAGGRSYWELIRDGILKPAGMETMRIDEVETIIPFRAQGYRRAADGALRNSRLADTSFKVAAGGLCCAPTDLVKLACAYSAGKLVRRETIDRMNTPARLRNGKPVGYGMGWAQYGRVGPDPALGHAGGQDRVSTLLFMVPRRGFSCAVMCNLEGVNLIPMARDVAAALLKEPAQK